MSPADDTAAAARPDAPPAPCSPCRGTGRVISGLGGTPHELTCPWCEGSGTAIPERNAQEHVAEPPQGAPAAG